MKGKQSLRKPAYWQDFEDLCKRLWGEVWNCPEIKKNGRSGQAQTGVDIYGVPSGRTAYWGIQCKMKDEDVNAKLTKRVVDEEIAEARLFQPPLEKLYIVTTANKDVHIEAYVREKDIESRKQGGFEIHLFSWEDIVDLVDGNKSTHDWYVNSNGYKSSCDVSVLLSGNIPDPIVIRKTKRITRWSTKPVPNIPRTLASLIDRQSLMIDLVGPKLGFPHSSKPEINYSFFNWSVSVRNEGSIALTHCKLIIDISSTSGRLDHGIQVRHAIPSFSRPSFYIREQNERVWELYRKDHTLVPKDIFTFTELAFSPEEESGAVEIAWQFLSAEYNTSGTLKIPFSTDYEISSKRILVDSMDEERREEVIEDFFGIKNNDYE